MPCYTVQTISVKFLARNTALLLDTLNRMKLRYHKSGQTVQVYFEGFSMSIDLHREEVTIMAPVGSNVAMQHLNELKRQYSMTCLENLVAESRQTLEWDQTDVATIRLRT